MSRKHTLGCVEDSHKTIDIYKMDRTDTPFAIAINDRRGRREFAYLSEETMAEMITWFLNVENG